MNERGIFLCQDCLVLPVAFSKVMLQNLLDYHGACHPRMLTTTFSRFTVLSVYITLSVDHLLSL